MSSADVSKQSFLICLVVLAYWFVSIILVFINRSLLRYGFATSIFVTCFQCMCSAFLSFCILKLFPQKHQHSLSSSSPSVSLHHKYILHSCRKTFPLSCIFMAMITLNNLCLSYVGISFYYVGRSLTTIFNVVFTFAILREKTSPRCVFACLVIILGFVLGIDQEALLGSLSIPGVIFGVLASLFVALTSIYTKKYLDGDFIHGNVLFLTLINNINAIFQFIVIIFPTYSLFTAFSSFKDNSASVPLLSTISHHLFSNISTFSFLLLSGLFGFGISYLANKQITLTSPLTHNISGTAKAATQTVLGVWFGGESKSFTWWTSNAVVLFGSAIYSFFKHQKMLEKGGEKNDNFESTCSKGKNGALYHHLINLKDDKDLSISVKR